MLNYLKKARFRDSQQDTIKTRNGGHNLFIFIELTLCQKYFIMKLNKFLPFFKRREKGNCRYTYSSGME